MTRMQEPGTDRPAIRVVGIYKKRGSQTVLRDVSFEVAQGEVVAVLGPSGAGKSTLLRTINHLETIDAGRIFVNGALIGYRETANALHELSDRDISAQRTRIGMVFQSFNLFRHLTAIDNVMSGPVHVLGRPREEARETAMSLLAKVGLAEKANSYPQQLSGGQQQRVAIARALAMAPDVLLLDEPTSALDPQLSQEVVATIRTLAAEGRTMMIATHEMAIARGIADRVIFMVDGEIVEDTAARAFFAAPAHDRSRQFLALQE
jgi:polar amino acid transport system ATP-binding protein